MSKIIERLKKMDIKKNSRSLVSIFDQVNEIIFDDHQVEEILKSKGELSQDQELFLEQILESVSSSFPTQKGVCKLYLLSLYIDDPKFDPTKALKDIDLTKFLKKHKVNVSKVKSIQMGEKVVSTEIYKEKYSKIAQFFSEVTMDSQELNHNDKETAPLYLLPVVIEEKVDSLLADDLLRISLDQGEGLFAELSETLSLSEEMEIVAINFLPFFDSLTFSRTSAISSVLHEIFEQERKDYLKIDTIQMFSEDDKIKGVFLQNNEPLFELEEDISSKGIRLFILEDVSDMLTNHFGFKKVGTQDNKSIFISIRHLN